MSEKKFHDQITVRIAHDKSLYIVYQGTVPPLDGQVYISAREVESALASAVEEARQSGAREAWREAHTEYELRRGMRAGTTPAMLTSFRDWLRNMADGGVLPAQPSAVEESK